MIDPHFWESACDKKWNSDDCVVMMAAISAADDYGRGRIKTLKDTTNGILPSKRLAKSLAKLQNSVKTYSKIYYFLPNWGEYQKVAHPSRSKIPEPKSFNDNDLPLNFSGDIHEAFIKPSPTVKVSLNKYSLNKFKVGEDAPTNNIQPSNDDLPLPSLTENQSTEPEDYENVFQVTDSLKLLLAAHCNINDPDKSTLSALVNLVINTKQVRNSTAFKYLRDTFIEFNSFPAEKQNLKYLYSRAKGRINDVLIKRREELNKIEKHNEKKESSVIANNDIEQVANKFQIN